MKKIFGLAISAMLLIALAVGGTMAFFSDTETSEGNVFTAGTIDLAVNDENPWAATAWGTSDDWKPGQETDDINITLKNVGTNPMDVWMRLTDITTSGGDDSFQGVSSEPEYLAEGAVWTGTVWDGTDWKAIDDIDTQISIILSLGAATIISGDDIRVPAAEDLYIYLGTIAASTDISGTLAFLMDSTAGNKYQGDDMEFTIEFFAQQNEAGTETPPGTQLTGYAKP